MTAQRRSSEGENTGFTFFACKVTGVGRGSLTLGRPWGPYSRVVFAFSYMSGSVLPSGWDDWGISSNQRYLIRKFNDLYTIFFTLYFSFHNFCIRLPCFILISFWIQRIFFLNNWIYEQGNNLISFFSLSNSTILKAVILLYNFEMSQFPVRREIVFDNYLHCFFFIILFSRNK